MNEQLFGEGEALTFDDVLVVPGFSKVLPVQVGVKTRLTEGIELGVPILSAAMDTVTESRLAIALAREGGLGVVHRNMSVKAQALEVEKVKRSESGMITDPVTLPPKATIRQAQALMAKYKISGVPIVDANDKLLGILTNRDVRFIEPNELELPVSELMTRDNLVTSPVGTTLYEAKGILQKHRIEKLPLVNKEGKLKGLITVKDIQKKLEYPNAALDGKGRLIVAAAVGVGEDLEERVSALVEEEVDMVVVDAAHGHSEGVIRAVERIKAGWRLPVMAGNVVGKEGTKALIKAGAEVVKVGLGAGSICTTRIISGAGMPQLTAVYECAREASRYGVSIVADGGIKYSGDMVKAIVAGAGAVMLGSLLAGLEEAPGEMVLFEGRQFKEYRGMGSLGALQGLGRDRYASGMGPGKLVPEGIEGRVPYKGRLKDYVFQLVGGLRSGMGYAGVRNLEELRKKTKLVKISKAGLVESHPHDVVITREAPNYQV